MAEAGSEPGPEAGPEAEAEIEAEIGPGSEADTGSESDTEAGPKAEAEAGSELRPGSRAPTDVGWPSHGERVGARARRGVVAPATGALTVSCSSDSLQASGEPSSFTVGE